MESQNEPASPHRTSQLRPPSKIPAAPSRGLSEISESDTNARNTSNLVSDHGPLKHKISNLPEPVPKRKTLAERAGEIGRSNIAGPPSTRLMNASIKANIAAAARNPSSTSSTSSTRTASTLSSRVPSSAFSASTGHSARPATSISNYRQASAYPHNRNGPQGHMSDSRPATALAHLTGVDPYSSPQRNAWDTKSRLENMEQDMKQLYGMKDKIEAATSDRSSLQEQVAFQKCRIIELEAIRSQLSGTNESLQTNNAGLQTSNNDLQTSNSCLRSEVEATKAQLRQTEIDLDTSRRKHDRDVEDLTRKGRNELEDIKDSLRREHERYVRDADEEKSRLLSSHKNSVADVESRLLSQLEDERTKSKIQIEQASNELSKQQEAARREDEERKREIQSVRDEVIKLQAILDQEKSLNVALRDKITESTSHVAHLESENQSMKAKVTFLESDSQAQSHAFGDLEQRTQEAERAKEEAESKLRTEETLRRKLHNQIQELKGNIRVFCRVRPFLESEEESGAKITYPGCDEENKEIVVMGPEQKSSLGTDKTKKNPFTYDRVFGPSAQNPEIFEEISQLIQSALDGYNVCIFCYGQTGSGKTYTMSAADGMIPLAVNQIYMTAEQLREKGWTYRMEGTFVEIYNENINDLLGRADDLDKKKHEIRHDDANCKTTITDVNAIELDSPATLQALMAKASKNRSVAATKANERSSRSHSVFILRLSGTNSITGEHSEGVLNLVDLAGSERLVHSQATGDRLKETQSINLSLSCLGDVIAALGSQGQSGHKNGSSNHIPYRNSKLTYLLQHSLGGNSKTLMFVMISPLMAHLSETLTSLKFATKVHNTHIGTAKKQTKVREV